MRADKRLFVEIGGSSAQTSWLDADGDFEFAPGVVRHPHRIVSLACPGLIRDGRVLYASNLGWPDVADPKKQLGIGEIGLLVNDVEAAALGESVLRSGVKPSLDLHYISLGTGVGAARVEAGVAVDSGLGHAHIGGSNYCEGCRSIGCLNSELEARRLPATLTKRDEAFVAHTLARALRSIEVGESLVVLGGGIARRYEGIAESLAGLIPPPVSVTVAPSEAKSSALAGLEYLSR